MWDFYGTGLDELILAELMLTQMSQNLQWIAENGKPYLRFDFGSIEVDPFPGYEHDTTRVSNLLAMAGEAFPIGFRVDAYVTTYEGVSRRNGETRMVPGAKAGSVAMALILWGKRQMIHPAMTRYLVAHEYGHAVEHWLTAEGQIGRYFLDEYAALRGLKAYFAGPTGGKYHRAVEEIFANDFRVVITEQETEFWPHPYPPPSEVPVIVEWWKRRQAEAKGAAKVDDVHADA